MKNVLSFLLLAVSLTAAAQCSIDTSITQWGFHPDTGSYLRSGCSGSQYEDAVQIYAPEYVVVAGNQWTVNYVRLDSVKNLPASIQYTTFPQAGQINGGQRGCISFYGALTAPVDTYYFQVYYTANFNLFGSPTSLNYIAAYYLPVKSGQAVFASVADTACSHTGYWFNGSVLSTAGSYNDTLTSLSGCDSIVTLQLTVENFDTTVTYDASLNAFIAPAGYSSYELIDCSSDTVVASGNDTLQAPGGCCFSFRFSNSRCLYSTACLTTVGITSTATTEWYMYPNPAGEVLYFSVPQATIQCVKLYDLHGRLMQQVFPDTSFYSLALNNVTAGIYYVRVTVNGEDFLRRLVIE